jgi:2-polyprenyl-3-methyl-5-hydroxy-6-metoxy-1,4-benzoquinol methylase
MQPEDYAEKNRAAWNQVAPIHRKYRRENLFEEVKSPSFNTLGAVEQRVLAEIGMAGKKVAQLCCNNGRELISMLKMGAAYGVGFDISDAFIQEACELAALGGVSCDFVRTDVLEISEQVHNSFDLVFVSIGALTWIADLEKFFGVCRQLLQPGGFLFIYEMHPFLDMMAAPDDPEYNREDELKIVFPYFSSQPWVSTDGLDYVGGTTYESVESVGFPHSLSEILSSIIKNTFVLTEYREYPHDISNAFKHLEKYQKIPLCYSLVARKGKNEH